MSLHQLYCNSDTVVLGHTSSPVTLHLMSNLPKPVPQDAKVAKKYPIRSLLDHLSNINCQLQVVTSSKMSRLQLGGERPFEEDDLQDSDSESS